MGVWLSPFLYTLVAWLANFQQLHQSKVYQATYATVMACIVANTATGSPAWALWQSMLHDSAWQDAAREASGPTDTPADKKRVMVAVTELGDLRVAAADTRVNAQPLPAGFITGCGRG